MGVPFQDLDPQNGGSPYACKNHKKWGTLTKDAPTKIEGVLTKREPPLIHTVLWINPKVTRSGDFDSIAVE